MANEDQEPQPADLAITITCRRCRHMELVVPTSCEIVDDMAYVHLSADYMMCKKCGHPIEFTTVKFRDAGDLN